MTSYRVTITDNANRNLAMVRVEVVDKDAARVEAVRVMVAGAVAHNARYGAELEVANLSWARRSESPADYGTSTVRKVAA